MIDEHDKIVQGTVIIGHSVTPIHLGLAAFLIILGLLLIVVGVGVVVKQLYASPDIHVFLLPRS